MRPCAALRVVDVRSRGSGASLIASRPALQLGSGSSEILFSRAAPASALAARVSFHVLRCRRFKWLFQHILVRHARRSLDDSNLDGRSSLQHVYPDIIAMPEQQEVHDCLAHN